MMELVSGARHHFGSSDKRPDSLHVAPRRNPVREYLPSAFVRTVSEKLEPGSLRFTSLSVGCECRGGGRIATARWCL